ncbi:MAG: hypothetical protein ACRDJG_13520 [Actinomycetota bacterium]
MVETARLLGLPRPSDDRTLPEWLQVVASLIENALENHEIPPDAPPATAYEWITCFPNVTALISTSYHQDALFLHDSLEQALAATVREAGVLALIRTVGQIHEILALSLPEGRLEQGVRWMGLSVRNPASSYQELLKMILDTSLAEISRRKEDNEDISAH